MDFNDSQVKDSEEDCDGTVLGDESNKGKVTAHSEELDRTG